MITKYNYEIPNYSVNEYLLFLINQFFKILPMKENNEQSLRKYIHSLQRELIGCKEIFPEFSNSESFISLISILEYMINNNPDTSTVKSDVFKAISICKRISKNIKEKEE